MTCRLGIQKVFARGFPGILLVLISAGGVLCQQQNHVPVTIECQEAAAAYGLLAKSLKNNLAGEKQRLEEVFDLRGNASRSLHLYREQLESYRLKLSVHRNILNLPQFDEYVLREAEISHQAILNKILGRQQRLQKTLADISTRMKRVMENLEIYEKQQREFRKKVSTLAESCPVSDLLHSLVYVLSTQKTVLQELQAEYTNLLNRFLELGKRFEKLALQFDKRLRTQTRLHFFSRQPSPLTALEKDWMQRELQRLSKAAGDLFSLDSWRDHEVPDQQAYLVFIINFFILLGLLEFLLVFCRHQLRRLRDICWEKEAFWQYLTVRLVRRSLLMLGAVLFIHFYPVNPVYQFTPLFLALDLLKQLLLVLLLARWGLNFLRVIQLKTEYAFFLSLGGHLRILLYILFAFGFLYVFVDWGLGHSAQLLIVLRLVLGGLIFVWMTFFWRRFRRFGRVIPPAGGGWCRYVRILSPALGYGIVLFGLLGDFAGFHTLTAYWYQSWLLSAVLLLWLGLFQMVLSEAAGTLPGFPLPLSATEETDTDMETDEEDIEEEKEGPAPVRWLLIRLGRITLILLLVVGVPVAWGGRRIFLSDFFHAVNYQMAVGDIRISVLEVVVAILFVFIFHTLVIIWKSLLKEKIMAGRHLDTGLQDAITTITGYVWWIIGLLIVLHIIGISITSLTVFFGALGIGLGFGLQNIFNNFLSGLIILFERPIKVGDVIDLNGTVGEVKKINVRSTRVKTYDNTDLIIPNSQFISEQLTNWSFKDAKVRRTISVGVAYGSDTQLVREILFNIAYNHPRVYHRPLPEVLFSEFGDSSLQFALRVWVNINYFISVETDIRFEIDRQFRENHISIPFPQRDVHIRS